MHVLITADTIGGVWTYARELVTGLVRRGIQVTLVSFGEIPGAEQTAWLEGLPKFDYRPTGFKLEWMQDSAEDLRVSADYLASIVREVKPDLLHLNQFYYGAINVEQPRIVVAHSDVVTWWMDVHGRTPPESEWLGWYREMIARGVERANMVVAPSQAMMDSFTAVYPRPAQTAVIYNGRTANLFNPHLTKEQSVLSVGRVWDGGKNTAILTEQRMPMPVYIVGNEQHPDPAFRGEGKSIPANVHMLGRRNEAQLRHLYARAAVYAATSKYEPFGLAPLEAAMSRCAIVANDIRSLREVWGEAALYYEQNNAESLKQILTRLSVDAELRMTYAGLAYQRARHRYSADRMVDEYLELYKTLVSAGVVAA
jgi:glycogen synthase